MSAFRQMHGSGWRSFLSFPISSPVKCNASVADPPLPQINILSPLFIELAARIATLISSVPHRSMKSFCASWVAVSLSDKIF